MFNSFDICVALEFIKKICENNRCTVCDKAVGQFKQYLCGHTICEICVLVTGYCSLCLTPPDKATANNSTIDELTTQRATNALELLNAFEKAFHMDVYKHQKMAKQLKLEKDLFPECIQAPNKYFNKRKSQNTPVKKKGNRSSMFPGETIYSPVASRIENSIYSVEQWFTKNKEKEIKNQNTMNENDESGIVIDSSFIDCSQTIENKDKQALLAVYEADKKDQMSDSLLTIESNEWENNHEVIESPKMLKSDYKVPFFKKSKLADNAKSNSDTSILNVSTNMFGETKNIQIMMSNNNECLKPYEYFQRSTSTHSIPVQTDITNISIIKENINLKGCNNLKESCKNTTNCSSSNEHTFSLNKLSQDVFTPEESQNFVVNQSSMYVKRATKSVIIEESESEDGSVTETKILEVSAQVHRFEHPVLSEITYIDNHNETTSRQNRRRRRLTPDSSNSSEKENLNPNRQKRHKYGKKIKK